MLQSLVRIANLHLSDRRPRDNFSRLQVQQAKVWSLNVRKDAGHANMFIGDETLVCRSDADNQLIVYVPFNSTLRLSAVIIDGPSSEAPVVVKLYPNRSTLGFDDVADMEPAQTLNLKDSDLGKDVQTKLKVVKFTAVNELCLFFEGAADCDTVAVSRLRFIGTPVQGTDMAALKKAGHDHE